MTVVELGCKPNMSKSSHHLSPDICLYLYHQALPILLSFSHLFPLAWAPSYFLSTWRIPLLYDLQWLPIAYG